MTVETVELQRRAHLIRANEVRIARKEIKDRLHTGELSIEDALEMPHVQGMKVLTLVECQPRWGKAKVRRLVHRLEAQGLRLSHYREVGSLTQRQKRTVLRVVHSFPASQPRALAAVA